MAITQLTTHSKAASFPAADITNILRKWWEKEIDAVTKDPFAPPAGTLADALPAVDSLTVVRILTQIESYLDFELPVSVVKRGGYRTLTEMTDHLLNGIRKLHHRKHPTKP